MVCDNCQVKTFTVVGQGAILETHVSEVDGRGLHSSSSHLNLSRF
jgi:hypothetical protein